MKRILVVVLMLASAGCLFASTKSAKQRQAPVALVDGRIISVASLDSTIRQMEKVSPAVLSDGQKENVDSLKQAALDSLIVRKLTEIREDSIKQVLNNDFDFVQNRLEQVNQTIMKVLFDRSIEPRAHLDSTLVPKYYNEHPDQFLDPEQVSARHILIRRPKPDTASVKTEAEKKQRLVDSDKFAKDRADAVMKKALAGDNWDTLAATYSEDANNSKKGGELGYFVHGRMMPEVDSAAFAAPIGSIIGPIGNKFGYDILKIEDHKQAGPKAYSPEIFEQINNQLMEEERKKLANAFLDSLKSIAVYSYNEEMLARPDSLIEDRAWIMTANGTDTIYGKVVKESIPKFQRWKKVDSLTVADKKEMLGMMAPTYLLRSAARTLGYMDAPEIKRDIDEFTTSEARSRLMRYMRDLEYDPSDKEVEDYYNAHIDSYKEKRPLQVYHILFQDSLKAEAIRDSIMAGADFGEMAKRYYPGDAEIREVLYNLDYIGPDEMGQIFYQAADSMKVGQVSHPVKTNWGYHLIKLVNRKEDRTLGQVIPGIKQHLRDVRDAQKTGALVANWRQGAKIEIKEKTFKKYRPEEKKVIRIESKGQKGS